MSENTVTVECMYCHQPVTVVDSPHTMPHHDGCAGYPYCSCKEPHKGDCSPVESRGERKRGSGR